MNFVRYGIPGALILAGLLSLFIAPHSSRYEAAALFTGAGLSVLLLNVLYRMGVSGDRDRDREQAARDRFDETGSWDDEPRRGKRKWSLPENIATPESEAAEANAAAERARQRNDEQDPGAATDAGHPRRPPRPAVRRRPD